MVGWQPQQQTLLSLVIGTQDPIQEQRWARREPPLLLSGTIRLHVKMGHLSIATHGLLLALQPSPPGLDPRHHDLSCKARLSSLKGRDLRT